MRLWKKNVILLSAVVLLFTAPLLLMKNTEFSGADSLAEEQILQIKPDYKPWFNPIFEPASSEIESLFFALQAAIGAGIVGFVLGRITGRRSEEGTKK